VCPRRRGASAIPAAPNRVRRPTLDSLIRRGRLDVNFPRRGARRSSLQLVRRSCVPEQVSARSEEPATWSTAAGDQPARGSSAGRVGSAARRPSRLAAGRYPAQRREWERQGQFVGQCVGWLTLPATGTARDPSDEADRGSHATPRQTPHLRYSSQRRMVRVLCENISALIGRPREHGGRTNSYRVVPCVPAGSIREETGLGDAAMSSNAPSLERAGKRRLMPICHTAIPHDRTDHAARFAYRVLRAHDASHGAGRSHGGTTARLAWLTLCDAMVTFRGWLWWPPKGCPANPRWIFLRRRGSCIAMS
jgi:hypothetical protein